MQNNQKIVLTALLCLINACLFAQNANHTLFVGTYTRKTSEGIYSYTFNTKTGDFTPLSITKGIDNPSYLAISPDHRFLYSGGSKKGDSVHAFAIDKQTHFLTLLNTQSLVGGVGATHLELDKTGKWLFVSNYTNGSFNLLPIEKEGLIGQSKQWTKLEGSSIVKPQQAVSHLHSITVAPNNTDIFAADLGTDKIMTYRLNAQTGQFTEGVPPFIAVKAGSGPRHLDIHPNGRFVYSIQEIDATVTGFDYKNGVLTPFQTISTMPADYTGRKWSADIHISPDGKFLYASNRAHESLAIFKINKRSGHLTFVGHQTVNGKTPRNFVIDPTGNFLLVANQDSDNIVVFKRNKKTGLLTATGQEIKVSQPACLKFMPF